MIEGRLPTVVEYYSEYINPGVNLAANPKQCCPFHKEDTPSFSYDVRTGRWRCFGQCHTGGDVVDMHQRWFHFNSRNEADNDLRMKYGVARPNKIDALLQDTYIQEDRMEDNLSYARAVALADTPERWLALDYAMSKSPFDRIDLDILIAEWTNKPVI